VLVAVFNVPVNAAAPALYCPEKPVPDTEVFDSMAVVPLLFPWAKFDIVRSGTGTPPEGAALPDVVPKFQVTFAAVTVKVAAFEVTAVQGVMEPTTALYWYPLMVIGAPVIVSVEVVAPEYTPPSMMVVGNVVPPSVETNQLYPFELVAVTVKLALPRLTMV
jgi:hypothetical protein